MISEAQWDAHRIPTKGLSIYCTQTQMSCTGLEGVKGIIRTTTTIQAFSWGAPSVPHCSSTPLRPALPRSLSSRSLITSLASLLPEQLSGGLETSASNTWVWGILMGPPVSSATSGQDLTIPLLLSEKWNSHALDPATRPSIDVYCCSQSVPTVLAHVLQDRTSQTSPKIT